MSKKITTNDILEINRLYIKNHNYSQTARELGFSPGTIKKYIVPNFVDPAAIEKKEFSSVIRPIEAVEIVWNLLTDDEQDEIEELWEEISL